MKSAVWLPGAGWTARHMLWVQRLFSSQCVDTHIWAVAGCHPHIGCDGMCGGLLDWSLKWTSHRGMRTSTTPFERRRRHANAGDGLKNCCWISVQHSCWRRQPQLTVVDDIQTSMTFEPHRKWSMAPARMLLKSVNARFSRPSLVSISLVFARMRKPHIRMSSMAFSGVRPRQFERSWNLSVPDFVYHPVPHVWTLSKDVDGIWMRAKASVRTLH